MPVRGDLSTFSGDQIVVALPVRRGGERLPFPSRRLIHQMRREILPRDSSSHLTGDRRSTKREICSFPCAASISLPILYVLPWGRMEGRTIPSCSAVSTNMHTTSL